MKRALVFSGGGSKGAYQYGAWKALREMEMDFDIVTGTSIGAINAALYAQDNFYAAGVIWHEMDISDVMVNGIVLDNNLKILIDQRKNVIPFLKSYIGSKGADITPFIKTIETYTDEERFFDSKIDFGLVTVKYPGITPVEILKKDIEPGFLYRWVVASCSCFPIFPVYDIDGQGYIDGGYYDNLPIATAFRMGADSVVAVDLNHNAAHPAYTKHPLVKYIKPSRDLGGFLRYNREALDRLIELGYNDTKKAFGHYYGKKYTFYTPDTARLREMAESFVRDITYYEVSGNYSGALRSRPLVNAQCTALITGEFAAEPNAEEYFLSALEKTMELFDFDDSKVYSMKEVFARLREESSEAAEGRRISVSRLTNLLKKRLGVGKEKDYERMLAASMLSAIYGQETN